MQMSCDREIYLESQLRSGYITMRDFVRGLLLSERFSKDIINAALTTEW
jgi:phycobilisome rod-core linker protein